jgi:mono/diheme cytochrome c family protein
LASRRWSFGFVGVGGVAVLAYLAVAWQPAIPPINLPAPASFGPDLVSKGETLAVAAGCIDCHTTKNGMPGTGGVPFARMFGTIYSSNITPDPETGIGRWSLAAFARALREGVARDGKHLFAAAFPFDHFTKLTDEDIGALYAYLMNLPSARKRTRPNTVPFPLDVRALQAAWKAIYLTPDPYRPDGTRDAQWNRGAYLVEAVTHCSSCHSPRNLLGAEEAGHPYGGALVDGWWATPLDVEASPEPWTQARLVEYLRKGESVPHGVALEPMRNIVRRLRALPDSDIAAIATYLTSFISYPPDQKAAIARAMSPPDPRNDSERYGAKRYLAVCGGCHEKPGATPEAARSPIGLSASLWMNEPGNVIRIVLDGVSRDDLPAGPTMPSFRGKLTDTDIAAIVEYLRTSHTTLSAWGEIEAQVRRIRTRSAPSP